MATLTSTKASKSNKLSSADEWHEAGRAIYNFYCYFCHGYSGNAKTLAASYLDPKPRNFTNTSTSELSRNAMIKAVTVGREGTAMKSFKRTLSERDIEAVVDFVRLEFMTKKAVNTRYHTSKNGWPNHERYSAAFPFALGEIAIDVADESLTKAQRLGKQVFLQSCVTCHDRARVNEEGVIWEPKAVSYPRNRYSHKEEKQESEIDAISQASPYAKHDKAPLVANMSDQEKLGEKLFQENCAFCHAADGTGKNWIGSFLESHPRNLTDTRFMETMTYTKLKKVIQDGLPGTTMSAWKHVLKEEEIESIIAYINRAFYSIVDDRN